MDPRSQERLDNILKKDPTTLTQEEIGFLRARRIYLKKIQLEEYASVLNLVKSQTSDEETVNTHAKK